jgi:hypothetical protein
MNISLVAVQILMRGKRLSPYGALRAYGDNRNKSTSIGLSWVGQNPGQVVDGSLRRNQPEQTSPLGLAFCNLRVAYFERGFSCLYTTVHTD